MEERGHDTPSIVGPVYPPHPADAPARLAGFLIVVVMTAVPLLLSTFSLVTPVDAALQGGQAQVWGQSAYEGAGYKGVEAYVTTPNPSIAAGEWADGPTAITDFSAPPFIESGPTKACDRDCGLHPYASWMDRNGVYGDNIVMDRFLADGGRYKYWSNFVGNHMWQAVWCDGNGCGQIGYVNLGVNWGLYHVISGGESNGPGTPIGYLTTQYNWFHRVWDDAWHPWCYAYAHVNVNGYLSPCGANEFWSAEYPIAPNP